MTTPRMTIEAARDVMKSAAMLVDRIACDALHDTVYDVACDAARAQGVTDDDRISDIAHKLDGLVAAIRKAGMA